MKLAIDSQTAHIYMGVGSAEHTMPFGTSVTQATLVTPEFKLEALPPGPFPNANSWIFQEESFDPASRLRRGRMFEPETWKGWPEFQIIDHPPKELVQGSDFIGNFKIRRQAFQYQPCQSLLRMRFAGIGTTLAIGTIESASFWRVVQAEISVGGAVVVTLKSRSYLGALPDVDLGKVGADARDDVGRALERAADAAHRELPSSVVDQCRNAMTVCLSHWLGALPASAGGALPIRNKDLAKLANLVPQEFLCIQSVAHLIARLHVRAKDNARAEHNSRTPDEDDADLAVQSLGFAIREFGWAAPGSK